MAGEALGCCWAAGGSGGGQQVCLRRRPAGPAHLLLQLPNLAHAIAKEGTSLLHVCYVVSVAAREGRVGGGGIEVMRVGVGWRQRGLGSQRAGRGHARAAGWLTVALGLRTGHAFPVPHAALHCGTHQRPQWLQCSLAG